MSSTSTPVSRVSDGPNASRMGQRSRGDLFQTLFGLDPLRPFLAPSALPMGIDVNRSDDGYNVELPVPGFRPEDIEITIQEDVLVISGKNDRRQFTRSLVLPDEIDTSNVTAHVDNGLLCIHLANRPETRPRRIEVTAGSTHEAAEGRVPTVSGTEGGQNGGNAGSQSAAGQTPAGARASGS
jgi:HSP20 family protein